MVELSNSRVKSKSHAARHRLIPTSNQPYIGLPHSSFLLLFYLSREANVSFQRSGRLSTAI
eukprot:scaffold560495_cov15-Prasinocladus_malaysianus.AAC.1